MKPSLIKLPLLFILTAFFSCKKEPIRVLESIPATKPAWVYHVNLYDHKTGEKITDLETVLIGMSMAPMDYGYTTTGPTVKSDASGAFSFISADIVGVPYLKIAAPTYVEAWYAVYNEYNDPAIPPVHAYEGSGHPNVVYVKKLRIEGNDMYMRADLYRKAAVDLHIVQVSDYSDTVKTIFNINITGTDPSNAVNTFGVNDLLGESIILHPGKKIDTTIRVYAFGDYLNKVSWSIYRNVLQQSGLIDILSRKFISTGELQEKIFPSDTPTSSTITF